jgi:predicted RND superfamily exporter protein
LNRPIARQLVGLRHEIAGAAVAEGFTQDSLALTESMLSFWETAAEEPGFVVPTNSASRWLMDSLMARTTNSLIAFGSLKLDGDDSVPVAQVEAIAAKLPEGVLVSGWDVLAETVLGVVQKDFPRVLLPMLVLVTVSLWLAFRRLSGVLLSFAALAFSILLLMAIMRLAGWNWNLMNMTALPLLLGAGIDYGIHIQLALRRHHGSTVETRRIVGRALLLCAGTTVAGFSSLAWSTNTGLASLGKICATGIACAYLTSVFLLPVWWKTTSRGRAGE